MIEKIDISGNGYKVVKEQEGLDVFHWVHTGDNKTSDIGQARQTPTARASRQRC